MKRSRELRTLSSLFDKYRTSLVPPEATVVAECVEVVADVLSLPLTVEQVRYVVAKRIINITAPGPIKTEIILNKGTLLQHLKGRLGVDKAPVDIL